MKRRLAAVAAATCCLIALTGCTCLVSIILAERPLLRVQQFLNPLQALLVGPVNADRQRGWQKAWVPEGAPSEAAPCCLSCVAYMLSFDCAQTSTAPSSGGGTQRAATERAALRATGPPPWRTS
eukprot:4871064-Prymnesium_polylepis.1